MALMSLLALLTGSGEMGFAERKHVSYFEPEKKGGGELIRVVHP